MTALPVSDARAAALPAPRRIQSRGPRPRFGAWTVPTVAAVAVLARLPFLAVSLGKDEAGFLVVASQWHHGGTSLYGNYWVDRPPLLISIFRVADQFGGLVPLRLIGCLATALVVLGSAHVARRIAGDRAGGWAAITAGTLCVSPLLGGLEVNGELLAAPFVVGGMAATLAAVEGQRRSRAVLCAGLAGLAATCALLVKQNIADAGVFATVVVLLSWRRGTIDRSEAVRTALAFAAGAVAGVIVIGAWTLYHGTSLPAVFDAMYPFRIEADRVMAGSNRQHADARLWLLLASWVVSGGAVVVGAITWAMASRRIRGTAAWALVATIVFDMISIALGGNYWHHYLVQMAGPMAVMAGLLVVHRQPGMRVILSACVGIAALAWVGVVPQHHTAAGTRVGHAIAAAATPRDTIVTVWGHADVVEASGLSSPYRFLWSLPSHTLDPHQAELDRVLAGPTAPSWFVDWSGIGSTDGETTMRVLVRHYRAVADLDGHIVYLHDGLHRPTPRLDDAAIAPPAWKR